MGVKKILSHGEKIMQTTTFTFQSPDGPEIFVYKWAPDAGVQPRAVVQISHGAAEHALRYERFARFLTDSGYVVYADDHRGHGKTAADLQKAGKAGPDSWNGMLRDAHQLSEIMRKENPGLPFIFLGHSMGSLIAQEYIQKWGGEIQAAILSGTFGSLGGDPAGAVAACEQAIQAEGEDAPSQLFMGMFAGFNQGIEPVVTGFEWLSRDAVEVKKYVDDPWCGFPFSNLLVRDFFAGAVQIWKPENEARIPKDLPLLVVSGEKDPAGAHSASVKDLVARYRTNGMKDITVIFYPEARHEILNETNRDQVERDIRDWMDGILKK
jgi:alpha-beta hydrolase superfamily lysophospholipase